MWSLSYDSSLNLQAALDSLWLSWREKGLQLVFGSYEHRNLPIS